MSDAPRRARLLTADAAERKDLVSARGLGCHGRGRCLVDAANTGDMAFISKTIDELVAPDALIRTPLPIEATGAQVLKEVFARLHRAYPTYTSRSRT